MSLIAAFFVRYWKQAAIAGIALALLVGAYAKGRRDCAAKAERVIVREIERRHDDASKERDRLDEVDRKIEASRRSNPSDDARDSCLLSNDPYRTECL